MIIAAAISGAPTGSPVISFPPAGAIFQRNGSNVGSIGITGSSTIPFTSVRARALSINGGVTSAWATLTTKSPAAPGSFSGTIPNVVAGDYEIQVQTFYFGSQNGQKTVTPVGVGENFLIGPSQSTAANSNETRTNADSRVRSLRSDGTWKSPGNDPQPTNDTSNQGSVWPLFAGKLLTDIACPIGFANSSVGGTVIAVWEPGNASGYYDFLKALALNLKTNYGGFRSAILFLGPSDTQAGTSQASFEASARNIFSTLRTDLDWAEMLYAINEYSFVATVISIAVEDAENALSTDTGNWYCADLDSLTDLSNYQVDATHYSLTGQENAAALLYAGTKAQFGW